MLRPVPLPPPLDYYIFPLVYPQWTGQKYRLNWFFHHYRRQKHPLSLIGHQRRPE